MAHDLTDGLQSSSLWSGHRWAATGSSFFSFLSTCSLQLQWGSNCVQSKGAYWSLQWEDWRSLLQLLKKAT